MKLYANISFGHVYLVKLCLDILVSNLLKPFDLEYIGCRSYVLCVIIKLDGYIGFLSEYIFPFV